MHRIWNEEKISPLNEDEQPCHYLLQAVFTDLLLDKKIYQKFNKFFSDEKLSNSLSTFIGTHLKDYLDDSKKEIISLIGTNSKNAEDEINAVFTTFNRLDKLFSNLKQKSNINDFLEKAGKIDSHELFIAWKENKNKTSEYVSEIAESIREKQNKGLFLLEALQEYRRTPEARKSLTRKNNSIHGNEILDFIIENLPSVRIEILNRIELYIESGWAAHDKIFEKYYSGKISKQNFIEDLQVNIGERFKTCHIKESGELPLEQYSLQIGENIGRDKAFTKAPNGVDACIFGVDGKLYVSEATMDQTGYKQGNRWEQVVRAIGSYCNEHNITSSFSVQMPSLFYDSEHTSNTLIKKNFIDKLQSSSITEESILESLNCLQIVASLDRAPVNNQVDRFNLLKQTKLKSVGNSSDKVWDEIVNSKNFTKTLVSHLSIIGTIIQNMDEDMGFNTKGIDGNVESSPIHLFVASLKGLLKSAYFDKKLAKELVEMTKSWDCDLIASKLTGKDFLRDEFNNFTINCESLASIKKLADKTLKQQNFDIEKINKKNQVEKELLEKNGYFFDVYKQSYKELILEVLDDLSLPFKYSSRSSQEPEINRFRRNFNSGDTLYTYNLLDTHPFKEALRSVEHFDDKVRSAVGLTMEQYINESKEVIKFLEKTFDEHSIENYKNPGAGQIFYTTTLKNSQGGYNKFANFLKEIKQNHSIESNLYEYNVEKIINQWAVNLKENLISSLRLSDMLELEQTINSNKNEILQVKISMKK